ncbi:MAG: hypothetical protein JJLCMIEE_02520 [Acidimicrobiales bacterium]|nr:hypothetical protein [Acidimicrobiales bacterium]RIK06747.1 MAG: hypothetical protein DCC48_05865 [Acidobacteriota bacterium]
MEIIDVREIEPRIRHETIFDRLDSLDPGESLRLVVDHDPVPLRYQLDATRTSQFNWTPVMSGPEEWQIDIICRAHVLDARPILDRGDEPFDAIMNTAEQVGPDEALIVLAPFEPVPLEGVLSEQGFDYSAQELDGGDWRVVFERA